MQRFEAVVDFVLLFEPLTASIQQYRNQLCRDTF